eukprot:NODE_608_length_5442_cov_0.955830.p6 type:complete len:103 gc:universal NODE_608_length_5442_cov_0.955830:4391-4083(-)
MILTMSIYALPLNDSPTNSILNFVGLILIFLLIAAAVVLKLKRQKLQKKPSLFRQRNPSIDLGQLSYRAIPYVQRSLLKIPRRPSLTFEFRQSVHKMKSFIY